MFVCELRGYGFESRCNYLNLSCRACFEQEFLGIQAITEPEAAAGGTL